MVQGPVAGRWTANGSPYCVIGPLTVAKNVGSGILTIESGVRVAVSAGVSIQVTGELVVQGTAAAPVAFERADPGAAWLGLQFESTRRRRL
ncbi:MAG: hypothetical protein AAF628_07655 [Planctomycetota bacterium]